jgi:REP element-mobilizing transposase RayT
MKIRGQRDLFRDDPEYKKRISHGGDLRAGKRKISRPLDRKKPVHVVLKSSLAKGRLSFLSVKNRLIVDSIVRKSAHRFGVTIKSFENMGNHIHLVLSFKEREGFQNFLRAVASLIARSVTGAKKGKPFGRKFWDSLAFTRVITGFRDFKSIMHYMFKNALEREDPLLRKAEELYEAMERKARRLGVDIDRVLWEWELPNVPVG